jgi:hypothetical protein
MHQCRSTGACCCVLTSGRAGQIYFQDGTTEIERASDEYLGIKEQVRAKSDTVSKLVRIQASWRRSCGITSVGVLPDTCLGRG